MRANTRKNGVIYSNSEESIMSLIDDPVVLYTLPPIVIGRHEWVLQVYIHPEYGYPCIRYC